MSVARPSALAVWLLVGACAEPAHQAAPQMAEPAPAAESGGGGVPAAQAGAGAAGAAGEKAPAGAGTAAPVSMDAGSAAPALDASTSATDAGAPAADAAMPAMNSRLVTFHNGGFWNDQSGKRIEAHGGGFVLVGETWYWFGEDKSGNGAGFKAVNCYASDDLVHWQFRAAVVTRNTAAELAAMDRIIERPKVIYNESTKQFVMWLHWEGQNYAEAKAGVLTSPTIDGPYTYRSAFRPNNNMSRDDTLFRDDDGKAYFISAANENADLMLYELAPDYLTVARTVLTLFKGNSREAPAMFKDRGRYYLITSAATGWDSNQAKYATATAIGGPWSTLQNLGNANTFDTQSAFVIPLHGSQRTTYIFAGDRWQDPDLASSKYIWLPLKLDDMAHLSLDYYADWQLDLATGEWSADDGFIPQAGWKLIRADSEETSAENGHATNAFDGSASTLWHTQYTGGAPAPPHELQIDLGARYSLEAMRYLPRQDAVDHGIVADYELYVSDDAASWNDPVSTGKFAANHEPKLVKFPAHTGRYVRFVAKSEINGREWSSVAELDLTGTKQ